MHKQIESRVTTLTIVDFAEGGRAMNKTDIYKPKLATMVNVMETPIQKTTLMLQPRHNP